MSSAQPGDDPHSTSPAGDPLGLSELLQSRGAPLLDALGAHHPPSRERSDAASSYAFAAAVELGMSREGAELVRDVTRLQEVGLVYRPRRALAKPASARAPDERARFATHYERAPSSRAERVCPTRSATGSGSAPSATTAGGRTASPARRSPCRPGSPPPHTAAMPRSQPRRRPPGPTRRRCCAPSRTRRSIRASSRRSLRCSRASADAD